MDGIGLDEVDGVGSGLGHRRREGEYGRDERASRSLDATTGGLGRGNVGVQRFVPYQTIDPVQRGVFIHQSLISMEVVDLDPICAVSMR